MLMNFMALISCMEKLKEIKNELPANQGSVENQWG